VEKFVLLFFFVVKEKTVGGVLFFLLLSKEQQTKEGTVVVLLGAGIVCILGFNADRQTAEGQPKQSPPRICSGHPMSKPSKSPTQKPTPNTANKAYSKPAQTRKLPKKAARTFLVKLQHPHITKPKL
jgi:hypothetical protein